MNDENRLGLQRIMSRDVGVLRDLKGLDRASLELGELAESAGTLPSTENWEATNLLCVATVLVRAARLREETRGSHWRDDFPDRDDTHWRGHIDITLGEAGLVSEYVPA